MCIRIFECIHCIGHSVQTDINRPNIRIIILSIRIRIVKTIFKNLISPFTLLVDDFRSQNFQVNCCPRKRKGGSQTWSMIGQNPYLQPSSVKPFRGRKPYMHVLIVVGFYELDMQYTVSNISFEWSPGTNKIISHF